MDGITPRAFAEFLTSARLSFPVGVMTKVKRTSRFAAGKNMHQKYERSIAHKVQLMHNIF